MRKIKKNRIRLPDNTEEEEEEEGEFDFDSYLHYMAKTFWGVKDALLDVEMVEI